MSTTTTSRTIAATCQKVFECIAYIDEYEQAIPHIIKVEVLSEQRTGVGTRFKETRMMGKREITTELEVTEYDSPHRVRFVSESGGTIWDTVFTFNEADNQTEIKMVLVATAQNMFARIFNVLIKGAVAKSIGEDMDAVKEFCESL